MALDPTYWAYIRLDRLLALQGGVDGEDDVASVDELHFIVVHQAIELLFKLILRELREARAALGGPPLEEPAIQDLAHHLARVNEALAVTSSHFGFMEALGAHGFLAFRDKLGSSSGAQSFQMRELEELLGLPRSERERVLRRLRAELDEPDSVRGFEGFILDPLRTLVTRLETELERKRERGLDDRADRAVLAHVLSARADIAARGTLRSSLGRWLYRTPICASSPPRDVDPEAVGHELLERDRVQVRAFVDDHLARGRAAGWTQGQLAGAELFMRGALDRPLAWTEERTRAALLFIEVYADLPLLAWPRAVLDRLVELEARLVEFRNGHARLVERVIGDRPGTGGSAGIRYLDLTRDARVFPELAHVRGLLLPRARRWDFPGIESYAFVRG